MMEDDGKYAGFLATFEPARSKRIWSWIEQDKPFQDSFSVDDWELFRKEVFLLTLKKRGREIDAAVLVERVHGVGGTGKPKYGFEHPVHISPPVTAKDVVDIIPDFKATVSTSARGNRLDISVWKKLIERIKQLRPQIAAELDALLLMVDKTADLLGGSGKLDRLAEQRDGLGTSLDIAKIDKSGFLKSIDARKTDSADSILDLFDSLPIHERSIIEHDRAILEKVFEGGYKGAEFQADGVNKVRVYVADKTSLETALGTDLIIYQSLWESLIFVQYKLMVKDDKGGAGWQYRPDKQFDEQAAQINNILSAYPTCEAKTKWDFRMSDDPFYFKFCEKRRPSARDDSLIKGISIAWGILSDFLDMEDSRGPKNGRIIGYNNCSRYLNNTEFSEMARTGWLGSFAEGTDYLLNKMKQVRGTGREPMLAIVDVPKLSTAELRKASKSRSSTARQSLKIKSTKK